jgi:hypothetical protein
MTISNISETPPMAHMAKDCPDCPTLVKKILQAHQDYQHAPLAWNDTPQERNLSVAWPTPKALYRDTLVVLLEEALEHGYHNETSKVVIRRGLEVTPSDYLSALYKEFLPKEKSARLVNRPASSSAPQSPRS